MTNKEAWDFYMKDCVSPESFITMSFYGMIGAALQRRVHIHSEERPLFPNTFIILVAEPAVGKGEALRPVSNFLSYHKLKKFRIDTPVDNMSTQEQLDAVQALMAEMQASNKEPINGAFKRLQNLEEPLLFPIAGDSLSCEALIRSHARSLRSIYPAKHEPISRLLKSGLYTHSSICFVLTEISSLFRKHSEDVVNYLLKAYDCEDYKHETIGRGVDRVINSCLNIIGGTTPGFMKETFDSKLLNEGFSSRTLFVYEEEPRFYRFEQTTEELAQLAAKAQILDHLNKLSIVFGRVNYAPDAKEYMKFYIEEFLGKQRKRINTSSKLIPYYGRKNIHIQKLAALIHFSEKLDMLITLQECQQAVELLDLLEKKMDRALCVGGRNPLGKTAMKVLKFLQTSGPKSETEIWGEFVDELNQKELTETIEFLRSTGKIGYRGGDKYIAEK